MGALLKFSEGLRRMLEGVALASGWLLVIMAAVTCFDVLARKTGIPAPLTPAAWRNALFIVRNRPSRSTSASPTGRTSRSA